MGDTPHRKGREKFNHLRLITLRNWNEGRGKLLQNVIYFPGDKAFKSRESSRSSRKIEF